MRLSDMLCGAEITNQPQLLYQQKSLLWLKRLKCEGSWVSFLPHAILNCIYLDFGLLQKLWRTFFLWFIDLKTVYEENNQSLIVLISLSSCLYTNQSVILDNTISSCTLTEAWGKVRGKGWEWGQRRRRASKVEHLSKYSGGVMTTSKLKLGLWKKKKKASFCVHLVCKQHKGSLKTYTLIHTQSKRVLLRHPVKMLWLDGTRWEAGLPPSRVLLLHNQ